MKKLKRIVPLFLVLSLLLAGCGTASKDAAVTESMPSMNTSAGFDSMKGEYMPEEEFVTEDAMASTESNRENGGKKENSQTTEYLESQKLVYECHMELQTLKFDKTVAQIKEMIQEYEGFVESDEVSDNSWNWYYEDYQKTSGTLSEYIVIRIPTKYYNTFVNQMGDFGKIISKKENVTNITKSYSDTEATIKALEKQEEMLFEMLDKATEISDMITVENRLADISRQLAVYRSEKSTMDMDINFSTISIDIQEVVEYEQAKDETTFFDRVVDAFEDSIENFLEFVEGLILIIIRLLPFLIVIGIIVVFVIRKIKRKNNKIHKVENLNEKVKTTMVEQQESDK